MKKENYGIPAGLMCVGLYLLGLYAAVNRSIWALLGLTVAVFALSFTGNVKKVAIQALALALVFCAIYVVIDALDIVNNLIKYFGQNDEMSITESITKSLRRSTDVNGFDKFLDVVKYIVDIAIYAMFIILTIAATNGKGIIVGKVHMIVDGFIPAGPAATQPMERQMYGATQSYNQAEPQVARQPMQPQAARQPQQAMPQQTMQQPHRTTPQMQNMQPQQQMAQPQQQPSRPAGQQVQPQASRQPQQQYMGQQSIYQNNLNSIPKQPQMQQGQQSQQSQQMYSRPQQMYNGNQPQQINPNQPNNK